MKTKEIEFYETTFTIILGDSSEDVFKYFDSEEVAGLSLENCKKHKDTFKNSFIAGLVNEHNNKPFIFLNMLRVSNPLIAHESYHLAKMIDLSNNEEHFASTIEFIFEECEKFIQEYK